MGSTEKYVISVGAVDHRYTEAEETLHANDLDGAIKNWIALVDQDLKDPMIYSSDENFRLAEQVYGYVKQWEGGYMEPGRVLAVTARTTCGDTHEYRLERVS